MSRTLRPAAALAIFAILTTLTTLTLIVAGCSNAPAGAGSSGGNTTAVTLIAPATTALTDTAPVATPSAPTETAPAETTTGSSGGNTTTAAHEQAVKFAECMRANGVSKFPDPGASGEITIDEIANRSSVDTSSPAWQKAMDACKDLQPAGFTGHKRSPQEQENALKFAQCIRDNGVPDFPDPAVDEPMIDTNRIPSAAGEGGMTILHAAMQKCRGLAAAAGVTGGK